VSIAYCDSSRTDPAKKIANCVEIGQILGEKPPPKSVNCINAPALLYGMAYAL